MLTDGIAHRKPVAQPIRIVFIRERPNLHAEEALRRIRPRYHLEADRRGAGADHANGLGRREREIDDAVCDEGAAIVDADFGLHAVSEIRDANQRTEGQRAVRGGECVHVVDFAVRRAMAVEGNAIPRCHALFHILPGDRGLRLDGRRRSRRSGWLRKGGRRGGLRRVRLVSATCGDQSDGRQKSPALLYAENSCARRRISRGIPVHLFALKFGIIGMRSHSRKEATERSRVAARGLVFSADRNGKNT